MSKGFTLIELLVVVLIIGILSAVALPQYEKTVHKARMSEVMTRIPAFERAITLQYLTEGSFNSDMKDFDPDVFAGLVEQDPFFYLPWPIIWWILTMPEPVVGVLITPANEPVMQMLRSP